MTMKLMHIFNNLKSNLQKADINSDNEALFAAKNHELLREHKIFSSIIPTQYGGGGGTYMDLAEFLRKLAKINPSSALTLAMHQHLIAAAIYNDRAGRPGKALLEKVAANELILISTGANDWMQSSGELTKVDGGYRLNAYKPFASGAPIGHVIITSAPFKNEQNDMQVLHFSVPKSSEGVKLMGDWDSHAMRETGSETIHFDDVFIPDDAIILARAQAGFAAPFHVVLPCALPLIMSVYLGIVQEVSKLAIDMSETQKEDPITQLKVGQMQNQLTICELACNDMLSLNNELDFEMGMALSNQIIMRKTIASNAMQELAQLAIEIVGGRAFYKICDLERMKRDLAASEFHPLPKSRQELFSGRLALGLEPIA